VMAMKRKEGRKEGIEGGIRGRKLLRPHYPRNPDTHMAGRKGRKGRKGGRRDG
jgi:hypothetical protein